MKNISSFYTICLTLYSKIIHHKTVMSNIEVIQNTIIQEFASLDKDRELLLDYLMDLGENLAPLSEKDKIAKHLVPGCLAQVWLVQKEKAGHLWLRADSNAAITKGLVSLLVRIFSDQPLKEIINARLFFISSTDLDQLIGVQRSSGFDHMVKAIKQYALKSIR